MPEAIEYTIYLRVVKLLGEFAHRLSEFHACPLGILPLRVTHLRREFTSRFWRLGYSDCLRLGDGIGSLLLDGVSCEKRELFRVEDMMMVSYHICLI